MEALGRGGEEEAWQSFRGQDYIDIAALGFVFLKKGEDVLGLEDG